LILQTPSNLRPFHLTSYLEGFPGWRVYLINDDKTKEEEILGIKFFTQE